MADIKDNKFDQELITKPKDEGTIMIDQILEEGKVNENTKTEEAPKGNNDPEIVKMEFEDLEACLVKSFGGYSRDSVLEFINKMKIQQKVSMETFLKNMRFMYDEKDVLKQANEKLRERLTKIETDYENLSQAILLNKIEGTDFTVNDVLSLRSRVSALEDILKKSSNENRLLNNKIDRLEKANEDLQMKLKQTNEEINTQKRLVVLEKQENKKHTDAASHYLAQLEAEQDQNRYLTSLVENGELAKLKLKIEDLTGQMVSLNDLKERLIEERDGKDRRIETLSDQIESMNKMFTSMNNNLEEMNSLNAKLANTNKELTFQLESEFQKIICLIKERSEINTEKIAFMNQLSEAKMRINLLEQRSSRDRQVEEVTDAYRNLNRLESDTNKGETPELDKTK